MFWRNRLWLWLRWERKVCPKSIGTARRRTFPRFASVGLCGDSRFALRRYPATDFAELKPRIVWDRETDLLSPRRSTLRLAVLNAGTIPDRGLYGVFLEGASDKPQRVGELDEEMVFETRAGESFC